MTDDKMRGEAALAEVRAFLYQIVQPHRLPYFTKYAEKNEPTLLAEVNQLKEVISKPPQSIQDYSLACNRYVVVSKQLIRRVGLTLARAVLPE